MKKVFLSLILCVICGFTSAQTVKINDVEVKPGDKAVLTLTVNVGNLEAQGFQIDDIVLPEGLSFGKFSAINKDKWNRRDGVSEDSENNPLISGNKDGEVWKFSCASVGFLIPQNQEIDIATLEIAATTDIEKKNYQISFPEGAFKFIDPKGLKTPVNIDPFNVNIVDAYSIVLDETSTVDPEPATGVNVTVKRTINANEWGTIVLPFNMTEEQVKTAFGEGVQLKDFTGYEYKEGDENVTVNFQTVTAIEKNHPYIIKVSSKVSEFTVEGVDIDPVVSPSVSFGYKTGKTYHPSDFVGTYVADFNFYEAATSYPLFLSGGQFWYASEDSQHMMAFRAYFDFDDYPAWVEEGGSSRIIMVFDGQTGIQNITYGTEGEYYDLKGQRVESPSKGIYIKDGKKVVVK